MFFNSGVSKSAGEEHSVFFARLLSRPSKNIIQTLLSLFNDCETTVCGILVWCCQVCPLNTKCWSLGTWGLFLDSSHEHSGSCQKCQQLHGDAVWLSKLPVSGSLRLRIPLVSGVAVSSLGLCFLFSIFADIHVSVWQSPSGADWKVVFN